MSKFWTPENVAKTREMIFTGHTASEIAEQLGTTRKAVIGKAWRKWGGFDAVLGKSDGERGQYHRKRLAPPPTPEELARQERIAAEQERYATFQNREKVDNSCAIPGCRWTKQANRFGLCAQHDQERLSARVAA